MKQWIKCIKLTANFLRPNLIFSQPRLDPASNLPFLIFGPRSACRVSVFLSKFIRPKILWWVQIMKLLTKQFSPFYYNFHSPLSPNTLFSVYVLLGWIALYWSVEGNVSEKRAASIFMADVTYCCYCYCFSQIFYPCHTSNVFIFWTMILSCIRKKINERRGYAANLSIDKMFKYQILIQIKGCR
jgi:hypothetical protein